MPGNPILVGIQPGVFYLQEGAAWDFVERGFDTGRKSWETHYTTPHSMYPQRGQPSPDYPFMYIVDVSHRHQPSGIVTIDAVYKGALEPGTHKMLITPGADVAMFTIPALKSSSNSAKATVIAPVPKPKVTREFVTTSAPSNGGVSQGASGDFFPSPPNFSISWIPDPDAPAAINYRTGWILESRTWEQPINEAEVWLVREVYGYYYPIST